MPEQHNHNLDPALQELEAALGDMTPTGSNALAEGSGQRDQLMFAMGQAAMQKRTRRTRIGAHIGTAAVALLVGALITLPWRFDHTSSPQGGNPGHFVKWPVDKSDSNKTASSKDQSKQIEVVQINDDVKTEPAAHWKLVDTLSKRLFERAHNDERYVSVRQRVLEHGLDALPESSTGHAPSNPGMLRHRGGDGQGGSGFFDLF